MAAATVVGVTKLYGDFAALRGFAYAFEQAQCYVVTGENGAGKTTLLRILAGLAAPTAGKVMVFGQPPAKVRGRIGFLGHAPMLYDELTAEENLNYFAALYGSAAIAPADALARVGLPAKLKRQVGKYSAGMRQRVAFARVLMLGPALLLLDEPLSYLDAPSAHAMVTLLAEMRAAGRTIVMTTHQRELVAPIADVFVEMTGGSLAGVR